MNVDDVSFLIINNESDRILYNSFKDKSLSPQVIQYANDSSCVLKIGGKKTRILKVKDNHNTIYASSAHTDAIKSPKSLSSLSKLMLFNAQQLSALESTVKHDCYKDLQRLLHNLVTINAHNMQEVFSIIPQESIGRGGAAWRNEIKERVIEDPYDTSLTMIRIAKNNLKIKHEISVFNTLIDDKPSLKLHDHMIHRVLMNSFYVFFPDFTDKNVKINIRPTKLTHLFDYETVQVALYHFIDNATKYVAPDSNIEVSTFFNDDKSSIIIRFEMLSLQIHKDERVDIFKEGYSGSFAKRHNLSGSGIGMARILELLSLNNGYLCLHDDISDSASYLREGLPYSHNTFDFVFNR